MDEQEPAEGSGDAGEQEKEREYNARLAHFIALLSDDDESSRWKAAEALGRIGDPAAVEDLIGSLWDDDERVRLKVAWALGQIGDPRALPSLRRLYRVENEWAQEIIKEAVDAINQRAGQG